LGVGVIGAFALADIGFGIYDGVKAGRGEPPARGVAIAESVVAAPQVVISLIAVGAFGRDVARNGGDQSVLLVATGISSALFTHGVWGAQAPPVHQGVLEGVSWAVGCDAAFSVTAIAAATRPTLFGRAVGGVEMALTAPQIAAMSYGIVKDPHDVALWAPMTAWSGALFLHGLLSVALSRDASSEPPPPPPPPEPPPPPKPPLLVPGSIEVGPAPIASGAGVSVRGRWW
jgi:hypothetical protein